jgi:hypothetical protein
MLQFPSRGLFITCTEGIFSFLYRIHIHYVSKCSKIHTCELLFIEKKQIPLTWNGGSLYMAANPHPCRSLAQSQLPPLKTPPPHCPSSRHQSIHTLTCPNQFRSGNLRTIYKGHVMFAFMLSLLLGRGSLCSDISPSLLKAKSHC